MAPPQPSPGAPPAPDRRDRILDAADRLFADLGYDAVSMRDVARAARVNKALVFYYFESKDGLFTAVLDRYRTASVEDLPKLVPSDGTVREQVHRILDAFCDFTEANLSYSRQVLREMTLSRDQDLTAVHAYVEPLLVWALGFMHGFLPAEGKLSARHFLVTMASVVVNWYLFADEIHRYGESDPLHPAVVAERREHLHWVADALLNELPGFREAEAAAGGDAPGGAG